MITSAAWAIAGLYFEACNCDSVCPCYSAKPPTNGYCEGNCAWYIQQGQYGATQLDGLAVIMALRCEGLMRETEWQCWFYIDDRATSEQFEALRKIYSLKEGGHLARTFGRLWTVQGIERAPIEVKLNGWQQRASILGKLGLAIGLLKPEAGPTLCRLPNVPGIAAVAEEDWFAGGPLNFDYRNQSALTTTFAYRSDT
jgi:hypothetical protein